MRGAFLHTHTLGTSLGARQALRLPAPAEGANLTWTAPAGYLWLPMCLAYTLVTAVGGSERITYVEMVDADGHVLWRARPPEGVTTNYTAVIQHSIDGTPYTSGDGRFQLTPLLETLMAAGESLQTSITHLEAGDKIESPSLLVLQFEDRADAEYEKVDILRGMVKVLVEQVGSAPR